MKNIIILMVCVGSFLMGGCGKKEKNKSLARTYYKLALSELADVPTDSGTPTHAIKKSLQHVEQAITLDRNHEYCALKATLLFRLGKIRASYQAFQALLAEKIDPVLKAEIINNYACVLAQGKNYTKALVLWKQLAHDRYYLTPEVALANQGRVYAMQHNFKRAKRCFSQAVTHAPHFLDAHYYLALMAYHLNEYGLVKNEISTILFLEPEHGGAKALKTRLEKGKVMV